MRLSSLSLAAVVAAAAALAVPLALAAGGPADELPVVAGGKADRLAAPGCAAESWPYVSAPCLPGAAPARVIAVAGENATVLVR